MIRDPQRLSRLLLVLALGYLLLVAVGLYCQKHYRPGYWCSNNRKTECSLFTIGRVMQDYRLPGIRLLLRQLRHEIFGGNWG